jgi:CDP-L-myo-inositol myo-inositolphosphotransferase
VILAASRREGLARACEAGAPLVVAAAEIVADPGLYRDLAAAAPGASLAVLACRDGAPLGPLLASPALGAALAERDGATLEEALGALRAEGRIAIVEAGARWAVRADTPEGRRHAAGALFEACRKPVDGMVSRHLNRHVSIFISKRLVNTPATPNAMSVFTFLLAVAAAIAVARGGYGAMLLGAALLQANSILDGVDGELARVRFQQSKTGQWLDTVSDDLSTLIFYAGLTIGVRGTTFGSELALCGYAAIAALALTMVQTYVELIRVGSGDFYALEWGFVAGSGGGVWTRLVEFMKLLLKKDFFIFLYFALAVIGLLPLCLLIGLAGHGIALGAATARTINGASAARPSRGAPAPSDPRPGRSPQ